MPLPQSDDVDPEHAKEWKESGLAVHTTIPARPRDWHSQSYSERWEEDRERQRKMKQKGRKGDENECNICFDPAYKPTRTPCCKTLYCLEHITDWLTGPSSTGLCPSCNTPCTISNNKVVFQDSSHNDNAQLTIPSTTTGNGTHRPISPSTPTNNSNTNLSRETTPVAVYADTVHHPLKETVVDVGGIKVRGEA
ncbi:hypothetical protein K435DRAFT_785552 [Dendrothele bispora CBS 962.96]|uniref:RING-type domain-containing protein n=1 Tax=Dendrothele bispora (strain CBS 962.96) TaxID=1314807 RepID=A0A4S8KW09_DENBC|nr:hypothetical protein K435DRAFT_785552 [Dendrothele bispora CBS 962.96]